jgi:hypothetical protein
MFLLGAYISQATNGSERGRESVFLLQFLSKPPVLAWSPSMLRRKWCVWNSENMAGRVGMATVIDNYNVVRPKSVASSDWGGGSRWLQNVHQQFITNPTFA